MISDQYPLRCRGFSLIELVATLVVIGIIAAVVAPNLAGTGVYDQLGFSDQTVSLLQYAQKSAIAKRRMVCVSFGSNTVALQFASVFGGACDTDMTDPTGKLPAVPGGPLLMANGVVTFAVVPGNFNFNPDGSASAGQAINVGNGQPITIEQATGYVHYN